MNKLISIVLITSTLLITGCASSPDDIAPTYVSPLEYAQYDCDQIAMEMKHVSRQTAQIHHQLEVKASDDAAQMGICLVLFLPCLFFPEGGDGPEAVRYANLKGEWEALHDVSVQKKCSVAHIKSPEEISEERKAKIKAEQTVQQTPSGPSDI